MNDTSEANGLSHQEMLNVVERMEALSTACYEYADDRETLKAEHITKYLLPLISRTGSTYRVRCGDLDRVACHRVASMFSKLTVSSRQIDSDDHFV